MTSYWSSRTSFVLATIGAAVGLGNIWRFSYVAGENGGAAFLIIYLVIVAAIGLPLVIAELALGRGSAGDAVSAFESRGGCKWWGLVGWFGIITAVLITSYYAVIAGWALKYLAGAVTGELWQTAADGYGGFFDSFIASDLEPAIWQAGMLAMAALVVVNGVKAGIERLNLLLMPLLITIVAVMAAFALTLPGSGGGVAFLLAPDWSAFARPEVYLTALGQAFFSLGLGVAVFVTYGGYLDRNTRIPSSAAAVAIGDTAFAVLAGLAIFGTVFALGADPAAGPKLAFITLPQILLQLPGGQWIGALFFFLLTAAALTSMVALVEVAVAALINRAGWTRRKAVIVLIPALFVLGLPSALSHGLLSGARPFGLPLLDFVDQTASNLFLPLSGLLIAALVGWHMRRPVALAAADMDLRHWGGLWIWSLRILAPVTILLILARSAGLI